MSEIMCSKLILLLIFIFLIFFQNSFSQTRIFEQKIWPHNCPDKFRHDVSEVIENRGIEQNEFGLNRSISNVSEPTISVHLAPEETANGIAVLIFPGGGYKRIVIDKEGHDVARWLNAQGITGIVVKYRTAPTDKDVRGSEIDFEIKKAIFSDAREAIKIVYSNAKIWHIDTNKLGVIGFSAGGHLCASTLFNYHQETELDTIQNSAEYFRPSFMALIYPALENDFDKLDYKNFPTTFIASSSDDKISLAENNLNIYTRLIKDDISAEIHLYTSGGHGFGLGVRGGEVVTWKDCFINWLKTNNFYSK
jgi:acetyl esterase/lipase